MQPIVIATGNPHKVREIRAVLAEVGTPVIALGELALDLHEPDEIGGTLKANALIKAISYAQQTGRVCLADDSGLEVDALGGAPGVISSHYCSDGADVGMTRDQRDAANNDKLLLEMQDVPEADRTARFVCEMVLASPNREATEAAGLAASIALHDIHEEGEGVPIARARGTMEGRIGMVDEVPRGDNGFGYDPLFLVAPEHACTGAELDSVEKNARSHRGAAARQMAERIAAIRR